MNNFTKINLIFVIIHSREAKGGGALLIGGGAYGVKLKQQILFMEAA